MTPHTTRVPDRDDHDFAALLRTCQHPTARPWWTLPPQCRVELAAAARPIRLALLRAGWRPPDPAHTPPPARPRPSRAAVTFGHTYLVDEAGDGTRGARTSR